MEDTEPHNVQRRARVVATRSQPLSPPIGTTTAATNQDLAHPPAGEQLPQRYAIRLSAAGLPK